MRYTYIMTKAGKILIVTKRSITTWIDGNGVQSDTIVYRRHLYTYSNFHKAFVF
jgi:hypothetical protein